MLLLEVKNLLAGVTSSSAIDWSEDHELAVATHKGLVTYDLVANPNHVQPSLNLEMRLIPNETAANPHLERVGIKRENLLMDLEPAEQSQVTRIFYRFPTGENGKAPNRSTDIVQWTPKDATTLKRTSLATLTDDCWLRVWSRSTGMPWQLEVDVTAILHEFLAKAKWTPVTPPAPSDLSDVERNIESLRARIAGLCIATFAFGEVVEDEKQCQCLVASGQRSGHLVLYQSRVSKSSLQPPTFEVVKVCHTQMGEVCVLQWITLSPSARLLLAGSVDGRAKVFLVTGTSRKSLTMVEAASLWPARDRARVGLIHVLRQTTSVENSNHVLRLIMAKDSYLVCLDLQVGPKGESKVLDQKAFSTGPSRIASLVRLSDGTRLLFSEKGDPQEVHISGNVQTCQLLKYALDLDTNHFKCHGAIMSPGGAILTVFQSISAYYDHLVLRTPAKLTFMSNEAPGDSLKSILDTPDFQVRPDQLEVLRIELLGDDELNVSDLADRMRIAPGNRQSKLWLATFLANIAMEDKEAQDELEELASELTLSILRDYALSLAPRLDLGPEVQASLKRFHGEDAETPSGFLAWTCRFCDGALASETSTTILCANDHMWPRCILSLRVADGSKLFNCPACDSVALPDLDLDYVCPLCSHVLIKTTT